MTENSLKNQSGTDWPRLEALDDADIDTSDIPPLGEDFFATAHVRRPGEKIPLTLQLDPDVVNWFKNLGEGYQSYINEVLKTYVNAQKNGS